MEQNRKNIFNAFDEHGVLLDLDRIPGENNKVYKRRLLDVGVNRANATYQGLLNGITRELGFSIYDAIDIDFSATPIDPSYSPYIEVDHGSLKLYEDYPDILEVEIELYDKKKSNAAITLGDVVVAINATTHFAATLLDSTKDSTDSLILLHTDSNEEIDREIIPASNNFFIKNSSIIDGTVSFSEINIFYNQVGSEDLSVMNPGDYFIDLDTGQIAVKGVPAGDGIVGYKYKKIPITLKAAPVIIKDLNNEEFKKRMFDQVTNYNGEEFNGLPTSDNVDIIREILSIKGFYWGK